MKYLWIFFWGDIKIFVNLKSNKYLKFMFYGSCFLKVSYKFGYILKVIYKIYYNFVYGENN